MMGSKQKLKGDEYDIIRAKHRYIYTERAGVSHSAKRRMARRRRHEVKFRLLEEMRSVS